MHKNVKNCRMHKKRSFQLIHTQIIQKRGKTKKFKKVLVKKTVKKVKVTISSKKFRDKKKLYVRVRAVGAKKWSKPKKVKIKK